MKVENWIMVLIITMLGIQPCLKNGVDLWIPTTDLRHGTLIALTKDTFP